MNITCCEVALVLGITNILSLAIFAEYTIKLRKNQAILKREIQEIERMNGKEKQNIKDLQEKVKELKQKLGNSEHDKDCWKCEIEEYENTEDEADKE